MTNLSRRLVTPKTSEMQISFKPYSKLHVIKAQVIQFLVGATAPIIDPLSLSVILSVHEDSLGLQTVNYGKS